MKRCERFTIQGSAPSWKNHRRIVSNPATGKRRMIKSEVSERWLGDALFQLRSQLNERRRNDVEAREGLCYPIRDPLHIELAFYYKGKRRPDLDNAVGGPLDALQAAGIIANDSLVYSLTAEVYSQTGGESFCSIEIRRIGR